MSEARDTYLETQVKTATPQRLRLMLIEGALRFAARGKEAFLAGERDAAAESLERCRDIVSELLSGVRPGHHPLNDVTRALYAFVFRALAEGQLLNKPSKLNDAIRVLEEERETWLQVCQVCPEAPPPEEGDNFRSQEVLASDMASGTVVERFSLDA